MKFIAKITIILTMAIPIKNYAQQAKNIHFSEILWVVKHPFIAKKAYKITETARNIANSHITDPALDGDYNGGQVDAFRHTLWMALLVQEISPKAALELGKAHEKGNYRDFKRKKLEEDKLPDSVSSEMDLRNNKIGIEIGQEYMGQDTETLSQVVELAVREGRCWKIKKDSDGNSLDKEGNIILDSQWQGKWINNRVLVPSDYKD